MFINYKKAIHPKPLKSITHNREVVEYFNDRAPNGTRYIPTADGSLKLIGDVNMQIGGMDIVLSDEQKKILGNNPSIVDIMEYIDNAQEAVDLQPVKKGYILINGEETSIDKIVLSPFSDVKYQYGKFKIIPKPIQPFDIILSANGIIKKLKMQRVAVKSISERRYETIGNDILKISYITSLRLKKSLDEILSCGYDRKKVVVAVESKVFGIGVESYTVGSNEFYQNYAAKNDICCLLDNGHYHPLEYVSDKIPALLAFYDKVALHVTRGVRWDSDHVVLFEDELKEIAKEIVRNNATEKVLIGLDYFDASINRLAAWIVGQRNMQKALLWALLLPNDKLKALQDESNFTELMVLQEELKTLPFGAVWAEYLKRQNQKGAEWYSDIKEYENKILKGRA